MKPPSPPAAFPATAAVIPAALLVALSTAAPAGCTPEPEDVDPTALEAALQGTRPDDAPPLAMSEPLPAAGSDPHRLRATLRFALGSESDERYWRLAITRTFDRGPEGAWRLHELRSWRDPGRHARGHDDGREVLFDGRRLAVRRAWSPWMERETLGGQDERLLRSACDALPAFLEAFGPYLRLEPSPDPGPPSVAGLPVRWEAVSLDGSVVPKALDEATLSALRDHEDRWPAWLTATHRPVRITGRLARREGSTEVLAGTIEVAGEATVEGQRRPFEIAVRHEVEPLPRDAAFAIPAEVLPARRPRPWKLLTDVLGDDLADVYRVR